MTLRGTTGLAHRRSGAALLAAAVLLAGCSTAGPDETDSAAPKPGVPGGQPTAEETPEVTVSNNVSRRDVGVDERLSVSAQDGSLQKVVVVGGRKGERQKLRGELNGDGTTWTAEPLQLEPGTTYRVRTVAVDEEERVLRDKTKFRTDNLTLDEQTYASIAPLQGETVGVGMPAIVTFDIPVTDRAAIERHLEVRADGESVKGAWHWYSDNEVHFRPKTFWEPGTHVTVDVDINSVDAGNGIYGQMDRKVSFNVGQKVVTKINTDRHVANVFINDKHARRIPISAGMPGYETRSGTKLIMEKFETKRMDAATTGVSRNDPEYYNIPDVKWAMRVTYSGEFLHGAPWSVGSQGDANVSHGCVGMSLEDAYWLFQRSHRGDVVRVHGTNRTIEPGNGWTDWDVSFAEYKEGSALS
jgi:lipoprotein-anchoring transpeptidase ErfK/SrfK